MNLCHACVEVPMICGSSLNTNAMKIFAGKTDGFTSCARCKIGQFCRATEPTPLKGVHAIFRNPNLLTRPKRTPNRSDSVGAHNLKCQQGFLPKHLGFLAREKVQKLPPTNCLTNCLVFLQPNSKTFSAKVLVVTSGYEPLFTVQVL